jgi:hypothetical protein
MYPGQQSPYPPPPRSSTGVEVLVILLRIAATPITLVVMIGVFILEVAILVQMEGSGATIPDWLPAFLPTPALVVLVGAMVLFRVRDWVPLDLPIWPALLLTPLWLTDFIDLEGGAAVAYGIGVGIVALAMIVRIAAFHWINHRKWSAARRAAEGR